MLTKFNEKMKLHVLSCAHRRAAESNELFFSSHLHCSTRLVLISIWNLTLIQACKLLKCLKQSEAVILFSVTWRGTPENFA